MSRLHGIDAPEWAQSCRAGGETWSCGEAATRALRERIASWPVECTESDSDRYGRIVAVCRVDGADVNARMVEQGWAVAYRKYSTDYVSYDTATKAASRGLWRGLSIPSFDYQMTPKISLNTRCSISISENLSINGQTRSSDQLGIWSYNINP